MLKSLPGFRTPWVDYSKSIAILLVIIAHQKLPWAAFQFIYSFHMPFFFMISGYLFSFHKHPSAGAFIINRTRHLLIPYFSLGVLTYLFWVLISQRFGGHDNIPPWKPLVGMLYGVAEEGWLAHAVQSWFLPCLLVVETLYYLLFRHQSYTYLKLAGLVGVALFIQASDLVRLPFGLDIAFSAILFYWVGHQGKDVLTRLVKQRSGFHACLVVVLAGLTYMIATSNGKVDMRDLLYGDNYVLFLFGGVAGSVMLVSLSKLLATLFNRRYLVELIGRNTLITLFFQPIATSCLKFLAIRVMHWPKDTFNAPNWLNIGFAVAVLAMQIHFILVINKYLAFTLGRTQPSKIPELVGSKTTMQGL